MNARHYNHEKLRKLRESLGLTQRQVAAALRVHYETVYRAEAGAQVSFDLLCDLCELYEVSPLAVIHPRRKEVCAA